MNTFIRKNHITFTSICIGIHSKASVLSNGYPYNTIFNVNKRKWNSMGQITFNFQNFTKGKLFVRIF